MDDDELAIEVLNAAAGSVLPFFATDTDNGHAVLGLRLDPKAGCEWPWGGRAPVVVGLTRKQMGEFLGQLTDVAVRVYEAGGASAETLD
jgi:hypothetical protein